MVSFEKYLRTRCHPLGWEESAVRFASPVSPVFLFWVMVELAIARFPLWRRIVCLIASLVFVEVTTVSYWAVLCDTDCLSTPSRLAGRLLVVDLLTGRG